MAFSRMVKYHINDEMPDYKDAMIWLAVSLATAPAWGAGIWVLWQGIVRPRLIPRAEVERLAELLIERHGEGAGEVAFANEYGAWRDSNGFEQGKWRRVRRLVEDQKKAIAHSTSKY